MRDDLMLSSTVPFSDPVSVFARIDGIRATLAIARALAQAGRRLDLAGIDHEIGATCAGVLDLNPTQWDQIRPLLTALDDELHALEGAMRNV